jgi:transposase
MSRVEVITGPERRRRWSEEQKRQIVADAFGSDGVVAEVARREGICAGQIYRWRKELREAAQGFSEVIVAAAGDRDRSVSSQSAPVEINVGDIHIRIAATAPRDLVASVIRALACR